MIGLVYLLSMCKNLSSSLKNHRTERSVELQVHHLTTFSLFSYYYVKLQHLLTYFPSISPRFLKIGIEPKALCLFSISSALRHSLSSIKVSWDRVSLWTGSVLISKLVREPQASSFICLPSADITGAYSKALAPQCCSCVRLLQARLWLPSAAAIGAYCKALAFQCFSCVSLLQSLCFPVLWLHELTARLWLSSAVAAGAYCKALASQCCSCMSILQGSGSPVCGYRSKLQGSRSPVL